MKRRERLRVKMTIAAEFEGTQEEIDQKSKAYHKDLAGMIKGLPGIIITSKIKHLGWDKPGDGKWEAMDAIGPEEG